MRLYLCEFTSLSVQANAAIKLGFLFCENYENSLPFQTKSLNPQPFTTKHTTMLQGQTRFNTQPC